MRSINFPVYMYDKEKLEKNCIDFFIIADSKHYFIYHLDVYQGNNQANVGIHLRERFIPTTPKSAANAILKTQIAINPNG